MSPSRPVIFLDVDGVLHPFPSIKHGEETTTFHRTCMENLQKIISRTDSEIVLSSSWRNFASTRGILQANLGQFGMRFERWIEPDSHSKPIGSNQKLEKILQFVQSHNLQDWVVLDDEDLITIANVPESSIMVRVFESRFKQIDGSIGLSDTDITCIYQILSR